METKNQLRTKINCLEDDLNECLCRLNAKYAEVEVLEDTIERMQHLIDVLSKENNKLKKRVKDYEDYIYNQ